MPDTDTDKQELIEKYQLHQTDTGSPEVQAAILTEEIEELLAHLKEHPQDMDSKRGLIKKVSKRRKLLRYLQQEDEERHQKLLASLGLKKK